LLLTIGVQANAVDPDALDLSADRLSGFTSCASIGYDQQDPVGILADSPQVPRGKTDTVQQRPSCSWAQAAHGLFQQIVIGREVLFEVKLITENQNGSLIFATQMTDQVLQCGDDRISILVG
jgi:hypothetical protein